MAQSNGPTFGSLAQQGSLFGAQQQPPQQQQPQQQPTFGGFGAVSGGKWRSVKLKRDFGAISGGKWLSVKLKRDFVAVSGGKWLSIVELNRWCPII
jgi:hypothetical protein